MYLEVQVASTYCYTGGVAFDPQRPTMVFIHGVLNDHSVWILQSRYFAHHDWNVLAPDLPGHCRSAGNPPATIEDAADFVLALLDAAGVAQATLVGHSMGSLIALEAAARAPQRVRHLALVGTAHPMRVAPALLQASQDNPMQALTMVNLFSRATLAAPPSVLGPGTWVYGASMALGKRVLASNTRTNLFYTGFRACDQYSRGEEAMAQVQCPVLFALGARDQMTPPSGARSLMAKARNATTVVLPGGHHQMSETPQELLEALRSFVSA